MVLVSSRATPDMRSSAGPSSTSSTTTTVPPTSTTEVVYSSISGQAGNTTGGAVVVQKQSNVQNSTSSSGAANSNADFFVSSLACVLTHLVSIRGTGSSDMSSGETPTVFHAVREPSVSIHDYLFRISRYFLCSPECFVMSLVYIDRIMKKQSDFVISKLNIHRLIVTSMMLAVKFFDDTYYSNAYYAKVGGVKAPEMNVLEVHFLRLIDWHLYVSPEEFDLYKTNVLVAVSGSAPPANPPDTNPQIPTQ